MDIIELIHALMAIYEKSGNITCYVHTQGEQMFLLERLVGVMHKYESEPVLLLTHDESEMAKEADIMNVERIVY